MIQNKNYKEKEVKKTKEIELVTKIRKLSTHIIIPFINIIIVMIRLLETIILKKKKQKEG